MKSMLHKLFIHSEETDIIDNYIKECRCNEMHACEHSDDFGSQMIHHSYILYGLKCKNCRHEHKTKLDYINYKNFLNITNLIFSSLCHKTTYKFSSHENHVRLCNMNYNCISDAFELLTFWKYVKICFSCEFIFFLKVLHGKKP